MPGGRATAARVLAPSERFLSTCRWWQTSFKRESETTGYEPFEWLVVSCGSDSDVDPRKVVALALAHLTAARALISEQAFLKAFLANAIYYANALLLPG